jgi:hypothetical protein
MLPPTDIYESEAGIPHGSRIVVITRAGVPTVYKCNNFQPTYPGKTLNQNDELGRAARFKGVKDFPTASAELQLATTSTPIPALFETIPAAAGDKVASWTITSVSAPEEAESIRVVSVTLQGVPLPLAP